MKFVAVAALIGTTCAQYSCTDDQEKKLNPDDPDDPYGNLSREDGNVVLRKCPEGGCCGYLKTAAGDIKGRYCPHPISYKSDDFFTCNADGNAEGASRVIFSAVAILAALYMV